MSLAGAWGFERLFFYANVLSQDMDDDILTIEEVARYLRVSERTVYDWAQKGEIPSGKIGTVWRFKKTDIERWVNERLSSNRPAGLIGSIQIQNIIAPNRVLFLNYSRKRDALVALSENLSTAPQIKNKQDLIAEILRREDLMPSRRSQVFLKSAAMRRLPSDQRSPSRSVNV